MNIVTWNANMAFRNKHQYIINKYDPDIMVIQECENPEKLINNIFPYLLWVGNNKNKGLAVFSKYDIEKLNIHDETSQYYIPFKINDFYFLSIWAMNNKADRSHRYIAQVWNILNNYIDILDKKVIILGDFNWNIIFDKNPDYPLSGNFTDVLNLLDNYNIKSIYHYKFNEEFGSEKLPTLFMHRKENKPYHVDYIFMKDSIKYNDFQVGLYSDWIDYSDHMPLFINI